MEPLLSNDWLFVNHFNQQSDWKWQDYRQERLIFNFQIKLYRNVCHWTTDGCWRWTQCCTNIFKKDHSMVSFIPFQNVKIYLAFHMYFARICRQIYWIIAQLGKVYGQCSNKMLINKRAIWTKSVHNMEIHIDTYSGNKWYGGLT